MWDLDGAGCSEDGVKVGYYSPRVREPELSVTTFQVLVFQDTPPRGAWRIWKLIPIRVPGVAVPSFA